MRSPEFWARDGLAARLLQPLGAAYSAAGAARFALARPYRASVPVICVGNLVAGGAGKTPIVLDIAERLIAAGCRPHLLSRGYGGRARCPLRVDPERHTADEVGDEPLLLARIAPTWVGRDRAAAARAAIAGGADLLLLDDGFQNPGIEKDLSLVVIDGGYALGNGRVIPAGPLREPAGRGLARADAVVILGEGRVALAAGRPRLHARTIARDAADLAGRKVLAFAGIGRPAKFFATLEEAGAAVVERRSFADHHPYTAPELDELLRTAHALQALPVTTAKDAVRIPPPQRAKIHILEISVAWEDPAAIAGLLTRFMLSPARHA